MEMTDQDWDATVALCIEQQNLIEDLVKNQRAQMNLNNDTLEAFQRSLHREKELQALVRDLIGELARDVGPHVPVT
jgi:hypothetical protein